MFPLLLRLRLPDTWMTPEEQFGYMVFFLLARHTSINLNSLPLWNSTMVKWIRKCHQSLQGKWVKSLFFVNCSFKRGPILRYWHCTRDSWQLAVQRYLENRLTLQWRHLPPRLPTPAPGRASWLPEPLRQTSTPWGEQEEVRSSSVSNPQH